MSLSHAVLDALLEAGATAEMIVAVVKADMDERGKALASKRERDAERQRKHRQRNALSRDVTVTACDTARQNTPPSFPLDVPPNEISNPPLNPPITPPKKLSATGDFEAFWRAYPRKSGKLAAGKAYATAIKRGVDPQIMLAAASAYAASPGRDPDFTKHASTWLNAGCYDDQIEEQTNGRHNGSMGRNDRPRGGVVVNAIRELYAEAVAAEEAETFIGIDGNNRGTGVALQLVAGYRS